MHTRTTLIFLLTILFFACGSQAATISAIPPLQGTAANVTFAAQSAISLTLKYPTDTTLEAKGAFDNQSLFGRFEVSGTKIACPRRCFHMRGKLHVGEDGSGFPAGTSTDMTLTLWISDDEIVGVYHLGLLPGIEIQQDGMLMISK